MQRLYQLNEVQWETPGVCCVTLKLLTRSGWQATDFFDSRGQGSWSDDYKDVTFHSDPGAIMDKVDKMLNMGLETFENLIVKSKTTYYLHQF